MIAERVLAIQAETKWDMPAARGKALSGQALQEWLLKKEEQAAQNAIERGVGYALLKRELGHGAFEGWLKDHGVSPRSAREVMTAARLLMTLSESNRRRAADLPNRKIQALACASAPMVEGLFADGSLDSIEDMTREQIREIVALRKQLEKKDAREAKLEQVIAEQDEALQNSRALPEVHRHVLELRRTVMDETEALRVNAHQLQTVMDRVASLPEDLEQAQLDSIVHPLMYALQGLQATVGVLMERGFDTNAHFHRDIDVLPPPMDDMEVARAQRVAADFEAQAGRRAVNRELDLSAAPKRGRGRPRKGGQ